MTIPKPTEGMQARHRVGGHFDLMLVSTGFEGLSRVRRHQLVYDALSDLLPKQIHALSIDARSPSEVK